MPGCTQRDIDDKENKGKGAYKDKKVQNTKCTHGAPSLREGVRTAALGSAAGGWPEGVSTGVYVGAVAQSFQAVS